MRDWRMHLGLVLLGITWISQQSLAQSGGYNYARPRDNIGVGPVTPQSITNTPAGLRSLAVTGLPTTATTGLAGGGIFPTAPTPTAFGPTAAANFGGGSSNIVGSTSGFGVQSQRPVGGQQPIGGGVFAGQRTSPSRTSLGIFGQGQGLGQGLGQGQGQGQYNTGSGSSSTGIGRDEAGDYSAIPGSPGVDYPIFAQVPTTSFNCLQQALPGYYADVEALCQVFHICALNRTYSFLCPNGTIFSQETLVCVWWNQADCASAPSLYANNAFIYDYGPGGSPATASGNQPIGGYQFGSRQSATSLSGTSGRGLAAASSSSAVTVPPINAGVFGSGLIRSGNNAGNFGGISPTANTLSSVVGYSSTPTAVGAQQQPFLGQTATTQKASPFGAVGGSNPGLGTVGITSGGTGPTSGIGGIGIGREAVYGGATSSTAAANNREYLPPRRP